ncbi:DMT family transporter [Bifidobacterium callimiconis]|uniref:DMT family transporter n=1 Tax=Bifidobacterium callimiconis TaxID=2306973 RepID=UPI001BDD18DA|nr:DMT family transporter [Bifidobacterium callimiconis]MBT1176807.1 DMT family transporter [Bifidobacterium callimiconis]
MVCLLLTALIWGFSFVAQVQGMDSVSPFFFNATRFTLGALSLVPILLVQAHARAHSGSVSDTTKISADAHAGWARTLLVGGVCGVVLFTASTLQQYGVLWGREAGRAGFITALYIVIVPLLAWVFLKRRITFVTVISVVIAVIGFYLLCITGGFGSISGADLILFGCAVLFAAHILVIDTLGSSVDPIRLSFCQFAVSAVLSWVGSLIDGSIDWAGAAAGWMPILYAGIGSVGVAYTLQVVGQQWVPPTQASLIMSLESFFSVVGGAIILGEVMTGRAYWGCALIFAGTLLAQMPASLPKRLLRPHRR